MLALGADEFDLLCRTDKIELYTWHHMIFPHLLVLKLCSFPCSVSKGCVKWFNFTLKRKVSHFKSEKFQLSRDNVISSHCRNCH